MKTYILFNAIKLIKKINSKTEFYEVKEQCSNLNVTKKYKDKRGRPFSLKLLKQIIISPEVVGLIVGEGYIGNRNFIFANSNREAIEEVINFLKQFNMPIKMYLEISTKNKQKDYEKQCKEFWEDCLKIKLKRVRLREEFNSIAKYGTIHLILNNSLIAKLLSIIILDSKSKIEKNKQLSVDYLRGIIAAEGNINIKKSTDCVYMVRISATKQEERKHYRRCLEKAGLKIYCKDMPTISKNEAKERGWKTDKGRAGAVIISRWENFIKIFELGLLNLHKDKKDKFLEYFLYNKFTKQFMDFGYFLNKQFTMRDAQNYFGLKGRSLNRVLTLCKQGYISRRKVNKVKFLYRLTDRYNRLYNKLNNELKSNITPLLKSYS